MLETDERRTVHYALSLDDADGVNKELRKHVSRTSQPLVVYRKYSIVLYLAPCKARTLASHSFALAIDQQHIRGSRLLDSCTEA